VALGAHVNNNIFADSGTCIEHIAAAAGCFHGFVLRMNIGFHS
jgi:hypothetical protein